eukprot:scaffold15758_cov63-Phaeocystis_antarctica.AAC.3
MASDGCGAPAARVSVPAPSMAFSNHANLRPSSGSWPMELKASRNARKQCTWAPCTSTAACSQSTAALTRCPYWPSISTATIALSPRRTA